MSLKIGIYSLEKSCGKTTSAVYLAEALTTLGKSVLLIDLVPFSHTVLKLSKADTLNFGITKIRLFHSPSTWHYVDHLNFEENQFQIINDTNYDFYIWDCPKNMDTRYLSMLDSVIIPIETEFYGLEKLKKTLKSIQEIPDLSIEGILLIKFEEDNTIAKDIKKHLEDNFGDFVFNAVIMRSYYLGNKTFDLENLNKSVPHFGFADYLKLANEIMDKKNNG